MDNKPLLTIFLIVFIDLLGFGLILPLLPFIGEKYGANPFIIGLLTASYSFFQLISSPFLGRLSDRYGRKKILIISQIGSTIGYILLAFANNIPLLFISRIIDGITGGNISIAQAYIADVTTPNNRARGMGVIGAAFGFGFIFGPAIGGILSKYGYYVPALFAALISLFTVFTTILFLRESVDLDFNRKSTKTNFTLFELKRVLLIKPVGNLIITFFMLNTAFSIFQSNFSLWTEHTLKLDAFHNGLIFAYIGIMAVIVQIKILPWLLRNWSEKIILERSIITLAISLVLVLPVKNAWLLLVPLTLMPIGNGLSNPIIQSLASKRVKPDEYGGTLGVLQSAGSLGRIVGPIFGGFVYFQLGKNFPFLIATIITFITYYYFKIRNT